ncbi:MAG: TerC family protein [Alphaproteobacteria bacterium]
MSLSDPQIWASLLTLTILEIVLGIDNVVFISVATERLPARQQPMARRVGLGFALVTRILFLLAAVWVIGLTVPLFHLFGQDVSWRDLLLIAGGLFLLWKGTYEIHEAVEGEGRVQPGARAAAFVAVVAQIAVLDVVFSFDSVLTAVGMAKHLWVMITAVVLAMGVMLLAAEPVSRFVSQHPTVKMLALSFLLLIGMALMAEGLHFEIPKGYLYFAVGFALLVEGLNQIVARRRRRARRARSGEKA